MPKNYYREGSIGVPYPDTYYKIVDPKTFAVLLNAVKKHQPLSYLEGRDSVFRVAL